MADLIPAAGGGERAEIERVMQENPRAYWKDEGLQAKYRGLIARERGEPEQPSPDAWRVPAEQARRSFDPETIDEWERSGGFGENFRRAQDGVGMVLASLDAPAARALQVSFDELPWTVVASVYKELALPGTGWCRPATEFEMEAFKKTDGGEQTIQSWGRHAPRNVAVALTKFSRAEKRLSESDRATFARFWRGLTPRARQIVLWTLGNN